MFRHSFGERIFRTKYAQGDQDTWDALAVRCVNDVVGKAEDFPEPLLSWEDQQALTLLVSFKKFIPGGRYLYYAGRKLHAWNNCYLLRVESDTREEWGNVLKRASDCLMTGGGIGVDYSVIRPSGSRLQRTGGTCSGPIPLMCSVNEVGRNVMQGGSRRSAIYASLDATHHDVWDFLVAKDWPEEVRQLKAKDFNFPAKLDMTNISVNWSDPLLRDRRMKTLPELWVMNVRQALRTAEPGFSFNFGDKSRETLRNA